MGVHVDVQDTAQEAGKTTCAIELAQLGCPILLCDHDGRVLGVSNGAQELLTDAGFPSEYLPQRLWRVLSELPEGFLATLAAGPPGMPALSFRRHGHTEHEWLVLIGPPVASARVTQVQTQVQRLEELGRVAENIGQKLLGPLERIVTLASAARAHLDGAAPDSVRAHVADIQHACRKQLETVNDLLGFVEHGGATGDGHSLSACLTDVHRELQAALAARNRRICYEIAPAADVVRGHRLALTSILRHLLTNALESTPGALTVRVRAQPGRTKGTVHVEVRDDGPGIPPSMHDQIFRTAWSSKPGHAGLGLMSARALATDLGGELRHRPTRGGACFVLTLPAFPPRRTPGRGPQ